MADLQVGNIGSIIRARIRDQAGAIVDVSAATTKTFYFKLSGRLIARTATLTTDGTDGLIEYATVAGDLNRHGPMQIQAKVMFGTDTFNTNVVQRPVLENLQP